MRGIDVSQHNGVINWSQVHSSDDVDFAILRCGFGREHPNQIDKTFERNYAECTRLGIPVGVYHYSYALSAADAEKEADFCLKLIRGKKLAYPIWYDIEEKAHVQRGNCDDLARAFCNKLESAGYFAGVYTFDSFAKTNLSDDIKKRYAMWIARIGSVPRYSPFGMHQYSWVGKISGISGDVDMNTAFVDYPETIKKRALNGFSTSENQMYKVSAVIQNLNEDTANEILKKCSEMGMTAVRTKM